MQKDAWTNVVEVYRPTNCMLIIHADFCLACRQEQVLAACRLSPVQFASLDLVKRGRSKSNISVPYVRYMVHGRRLIYKTCLSQSQQLDRTYRIIVLHCIVLYCSYVHISSQPDRHKSASFAHVLRQSAHDCPDDSLLSHPI